MRGMVLVLLLLLLLAFLDMKKTHVASRVTRVVPSHAVGMDGVLFCHVSMTTPASKSTLVSFVAMLKHGCRIARIKELGTLQQT